MKKLSKISIGLFFIIGIICCKNYKTEETTINGWLYYTNNALTLVPCSDKDITVAITDNTKQLINLYADSLAFYYIGEPVYVELKGELKIPKQKIIVNEATPYHFTAKEVIMLTQQANAPCDCRFCDYSGGGNTPNRWTFDISEIDETITLRDYGAKQSYRFDYTDPEQQGDTLLYKVQNLPIETHIEIKINCLLERGELSSEKEFETWVTLNDKIFRGKAKRCY